MNSELKHIFSDSPCPSEEMFIRYLEGALSEDEKHNIELHLNACEMCSDFVDGLSEMPDMAQLPLIEEELHKKIDTLVKTEKKTNFPFYLKIAASLILLTGLTFIIYYQYPKKESKTIEVAQNKSIDKPAEDEMPPAPPVKPLLKTPEKTGIEEEEQVTRYGKSGEGAAKQVVVYDIEMDAEDKGSDIVPAAARDAKDSRTTGYLFDKLSKSEVSKDESISREEIAEYKPVATEAKKLNENEKTVTGDATTGSTENVTTVSTIYSESKIVSGKKVAKVKTKNDSNKEERDDNVSFSLAQAEAPVQENAPVAGGLINQTDSNTEPSKETVKEKFNHGEFQQVLQVLETPPMRDEKTEELQYYRGISYFKTGQFQKAYSLFNELIKSQSSILKNDIQWYYAMTLLSIGQKDEAKKQFENIAASNSPYAPDAKKELEKLK